MRRFGLLLPSWQGAFEKTIIYLLASSVLISAVYADVSWTGGVSQVGPVVFGGSPYCTYQVTLGNVEMVLTLDQSAYTSSVQGLSIEEGLNGCPLGTTPPNLHHYSATAANVTRLGDQFHIVYTPDPANGPQASLVFDGAFDKTRSGSAVSGTLSWHRTDQGPPLDWSVETFIEVTTRAPEVQCPPDLTICPSQSSDASFTGKPTVIFSCSPINEIDLLPVDNFDFEGNIQRTWTAVDPICGTSLPCTQLITIVRQDNPTISSSTSASGLVVTFNAGGTRGSIQQADWSLNGDPLIEGDGVSFLDSNHATLQIDFSIFDRVAPGSTFTVNVNVRTSCTAQGGAGGNGQSPPLFALTRGNDPIPVATLDSANGPALSCATFGVNSRLFLLQAQDSGYALLTPSSSSVKLGILASGSSLLQPVTLACGDGKLHFPVIASKKYVAVAEGAGNFSLTGQIVDLDSLLDVQFPADVVDALCNNIGPESTGSPILISPCSTANQVEILPPLDSFDQFNNVSRTWTVIDHGCGLTKTHVQNIFTRAIFVSITPRLASSDFDGLVQHFVNDLSVSGTITPQWFLNGESVNGQAGISFDSYGLTIDFTTFKGGAYAPNSSFDIQYSATVEVGPHCTGTVGGPSVPGTTPAVPYTLSRSPTPPVPVGSGGGSSSYPGSCLTGANLKAFYFKSPTGISGFARMTVSAGAGVISRLAAISSGLTLGAVNELGCGNNQIIFPVEQNKNYVVLVEQPNAYTFQSIVEDAAARITLSGNLAFGNVPVGSSATGILNIANVGNAPLVVNEISYPPQFSGSYAGTIQPGDSHNVVVTFSPSAVEPYSGTLKVKSNAAAEGADTVQVSGNGVSVPTAILTVSGTLEFGDVQIGTAQSKTFTIQNTGTAPLQVNSVTYPPGFSGNFSGTIGSGGSQTITVTFSPILAITYGGTLSVNSDAGVSGLLVSGRGIAPIVPVIRNVSLVGDLGFGKVEEGSTATLTLNIINAGTAALTVFDVKYPDGFVGDWSSGIVLPQTIQPVKVTFSPTAAMNYGGKVTVNSDANDGVNTLGIFGIGIEPTTRILNLNGDLAFGAVEVNTTAARSLTVRNTGNSPLNVSALTYPPGFSGDWSAGILAPGASKVVTVTFKPTTEGTYAGAITVTADQTGGTTSINVAGSGKAALTKIIALSGNLNFGSVPVGSKKTTTLTIINKGTGPLTVTGILYPSETSGDWKGGVIPVGGSQPVAVTFSPAVGGAVSGNVVVESDATSGPNAFAIFASGYVASFSAAELENNIGGAFQLSIITDAGRTLILEASPDLKVWVEVKRVQTVQTQIQLSDFPPPGTTHRFYRFRLQ